MPFEGGIRRRDKNTRKEAVNVARGAARMNKVREQGIVLSAKSKRLVDSPSRRQIMKQQACMFVFRKLLSRWNFLTHVAPEQTAAYMLGRTAGTSQPSLSWQEQIAIWAWGALLAHTPVRVTAGTADGGRRHWGSGNMPA